MKRIYLLLLLPILISYCKGENKKLPKPTETPAKIMAKNEASYYGSVHLVGQGLQDRAGNMWFTTTGEGVYRNNGKSFTHFTMADGLPSDEVSCITEDKAGNIWLGTAGGACYYNGKDIISLPMVSPGSINVLGGSSPKNQSANVSSSKSVISIIEDKNGIIWMGTSGGAFRYDGNPANTGQPSITNFLSNECGSAADIAPHNIVNCMHQDTKGNLWLSSRICGGLYQLGNNAHPGNKEGFVKITTKEGLSQSFECILEDKAGNIWLGTYDSGVYRYDGKTLEHFSTKDDLNTNYVKAIYEDKQGNIWFATYGKHATSFQGNGVFRYNGKSLAHFTARDGLGNNNVSCITEDNNGNVWLGTDYGASSYDGRKITTYTQNDGLSSNHVTSITKDKKGDLWIGSWEVGITRYNGQTFTGLTDYEAKP